MTETVRTMKTNAFSKNERGERSAALGLCLFSVPAVTALVLGGLNGKIFFWSSVCGAVAALLLFICGRKRTAGAVLVLCLCVLASAVRAGTVYMESERFAARLVKELAGTPHTFEARVTDGNMTAAGNLFVELTTVDGRPLSRSVKAYTYNRSGHFAVEGSRLAFTASLVPVSNREGSDFDSVGWLKGKGVYVTLSGLTDVTPLENTPSLHMRVRSVVTVGIERALSTLPDKTLYTRTRAMILGLVSGDKAAFSSADRDSFAHSGITHILCVSGLHFSLVLGGAGYVSSWIVRKRRTRFVLLSVLSLMYLTLCGFAVSAVRAAVMSLLSGFGFYAHPRRCTDGVLAAAAVMCLLDPVTVLDIGFRLSVLSCVGIALFSGLSKVAEHRLYRHRVLSFVVGSLLLSAAAYAATGVYTAFVFGGTSLSWIIASGLAVLPAQLCLACGFLAALVVPVVPPLAAAFGSALGVLSEAVYAVAAHFSVLPYTVESGKSTFFGSVWFFAVLFIGAAAIGNKAKGARLCLVLLAVTLGMLGLLR